MAKTFFKAGGTAERRKRSFRPGIVVIIPGLFFMRTGIQRKNVGRADGCPAHESEKILLTIVYGYPKETYRQSEPTDVRRSLRLKK